MAKIILLPQFIDTRGELTVIEKLPPFNYKRVKIIKKPVGVIRGNNQTLKAHQSILCVSGSVDVIVRINDNYECFCLDSANKCLLLEPQDCYQLENFQDNSIILLVSNQEYDTIEFIEPNQVNSVSNLSNNSESLCAFSSNPNRAIV